MLRERRWQADEFPFASLYFSQFGEDVYLQSLFRNRSQGTYIDVGAFHPFYFSNTYMLYKNGWSGINIEPNPSGYDLLSRFRPRDVNIQAAIGKGDQTERAFFCQGPWSSLTEEHASRSGHTPQKISVPVTTLQEIAEKYNLMRPDLLTVDCEGHDLEVLRTVDWSSFRPLCVIAEDDTDNPKSELLRHMDEQGYQLNVRLGLSVIWLRT
jgi:FkbM family methyltransferase